MSPKSRRPPGNAEMEALRGGGIFGDAIEFCKDMWDKYVAEPARELIRNS